MAVPADWIDRLLGVLVDNACRYTPPGGVVVVSTQRQPGGRVGIRVDDTGPGIPPEDRERVLDRFHRGTLEPGGVGLGLAIADALVRHSGGRWHLGEAEGGGARFEVTWPAARAQRPAGWEPAEQEGRDQSDSADAPLVN